MGKFVLWGSLDLILGDNMFTSLHYFLISKHCIMQLECVVSSTKVEGRGLSQNSDRRSTGLCWRLERILD